MVEVSSSATKQEYEEKPNMIRRVQGVVHGKMIEIEEDLGLSDGDKVQMIIERADAAPPKWGEGLRRCAGALADDWTDDDDANLNQIRQDRHSDSRPELE